MKELCVFGYQHFLNSRLHRELGKSQVSVLKFLGKKGTDLSGKNTFFNFKWIKQLKKISGQLKHVTFNKLSKITMENLRAQIRKYLSCEK